MKRYTTHPFYNSIRFRFGLLFNCLLLLFLSGIIFLVYSTTRKVLEKDFTRRLSSGATAILRKTDINPVTIPIPQNGEYFLITYDNKILPDTLFNALPPKAPNAGVHVVSKGKQWWSFKTIKELETGGIISVVYTLSAAEYNSALGWLKTLLFLYIPIAVILSFIMGYFLSGIFLRPLNRMIAKTAKIDLANDIKLLEEPVVKDELYELTDAINRMLTRIERQSQQQNAFFASASHELRTPLANMLTELQTIDKTAVSGEINQLVYNQINEVKRLKGLVNNFLWMSQLKADSIITHKTKLDIAELIVEIVESFQPKALEKRVGIKLIAEPPDASFIVTGDKNQLAMVLSNLTENAIKYGLAESVIQFKITVSGQFISTKITNVTDHIIADAESLKNEFTRVTAFDEGFGLGLWIADQLLQKNRGLLLLSYENAVFTAKIKLHLVQ